MDNRSLDEFLGADPDDGEAGAGDESAADEPTETGDGDTDADDGTAARVDPTTVAPAESTYAVTPGECAVCGGTADRRWHDDPGLVCADCKEW